MFQVNLGEKVLYYPASESAAIYDTELNEDIGQAGTFSFKVPPQNPLYGELTMGALITIRNAYDIILSLIKFSKITAAVSNKTCSHKNLPIFIF